LPRGTANDLHSALAPKTRSASAVFFAVYHSLLCGPRSISGVSRAAAIAWADTMAFAHASAVAPCSSD